MKICTKCGRTLPLTEFHRKSTGKNGRDSKCKKCKLVEYKEYYHKKREEYLKTDAAYYQKNKERLSIYYKKRYKGYIVRDRSLRLDVLKKINPKLDCKECGIDDIRVLVIDHIKNDGYKERREMNYSSFYRKILKMSAEEISEKYQILCRNCNWIRRLEDIEQKLNQKT